ncbi:MAG: PDZ domain-containing protein, partial [bacterium]|nr:PDZ domain-containing protein [bacterium]
TEVDPEYEGFSRMFIKLSDNSEERIPAKVIGWDKEFDIALLKTEIDPSYIFSLSKSYKPVIGEKIYAIGSPGGLKNTTTSGFVSSLSRQIQPIGDSLQIDVPINPGNSGGPLLNSDAEVMGIIFAGIEQFEGVNFAIPVSDVKEFLPAMYQGGEVEHPWLGCGLFERENHLEVLYVIPGTPAEEIGLERGDIIISIDDKKFTKIADTQRYILRNDIGTLLKIKWLRKSGFYSSVVSIDKRPSLPMETALERDIIDNLFVPLFGMEVERIKGNGNKNILYSLKNVYPGSTADEAGLSIGDSIYLLKWIEDKENKIFYIQIIMKNRKAGFLESIVQVGTYLIKGFII